MLAELVAAIVKLALDTKQVNVVHLPGQTHYAFQQPNGVCEIKKIPRKPTKMVANDLASFIKLMKSYCASQDNPSATAPIITVDAGEAHGIRIIGHPSGLVQEDRICLNINASPEFKAMRLLEDGVSIPDFVRIVRRDLFDSVPTGLLEQVRQIDFVETSRTNMVVQNSGRESMGRTVELQTRASHDALPDAVPVQFMAINPDVPITGLVQCVEMAIVQVDTKNQRISLVLPKDGLNRSMEAAAKAVADELQACFDRLTEENAISIDDTHVIRVVLGA